MSNRSGGFFRGTKEDDPRYIRKQASLKNSFQYPPEFDQGIDMRKVKLDVLKPWISQKLTEALDGYEDEVLIGLVINMLEPNQKQQLSFSSLNALPDFRELQLTLTGFLAKRAAPFVLDLYRILKAAEEGIDGVPTEFVELRKRQLIEQKEREETMWEEMRRKREARAKVEQDMKRGRRIYSRSRSRSRERPGYRERNGSKYHEQGHALERKRSLTPSRSPSTGQRRNLAHGQPSPKNHSRSRSRSDSGRQVYHRHKSHRHSHHRSHRHQHRHRRSHSTSSSSSSYQSQSSVDAVSAANESVLASEPQCIGSTEQEAALTAFLREQAVQSIKNQR